MYCGVDEGRLSDYTADRSSDEHETDEQCPRVHHHATDHVEYRWNDDADAREEDGRLAAETVAPGTAEHRQEQGWHLLDVLVVHDVQRGRRLHVVLQVRIGAELRALDRRRLVAGGQNVATHALRDVQPNARVQQRVSGFEQKVYDFCR